VWADSAQLPDPGIFVRLFDANGTPAADELAVHSYLTSDKFVPRVTGGASGTFVVVWPSTDQDGDGDGVFGRHLDASGAPVGSEFRVNTNTADAQYRPAVSNDGAGEVVVVWQRNLAAQSSDIAGQRYRTTAAGGACGDPVALVARRSRVRAHVITASDALAILRVAVGLGSCELCVCDVNDSGGVTAADALVVLRAAVGQAAPLNCPACG
jgi:hypothetical protein